MEYFRLGDMGRCVWGGRGWEGGGGKTPPEGHCCRLVLCGWNVEEFFRAHVGSGEELGLL